MYSTSKSAKSHYIQELKVSSFVLQWTPPLPIWRYCDIIVVFRCKYDYCSQMSQCLGICWPGLSSDPFCHREYRRGEDINDREGTPNRSYRKRPLLLKSNHSTHILLAALIFPKWSCGWSFRHKRQLLCWPPDIHSVIPSPHTCNNGC
jgi:hypothetical protein